MKSGGWSTAASMAEKPEESPQPIMPMEISFETIVGHARPKAILRAALAGGRIAHAYLFHGEARIGKLLAATAFAKAALCDRRSDSPGSGSVIDSCNACNACHTVDSGNHPDLRVIRPDGTQIKIAQIRDLQEAIAYKPLAGPRKWFVIDDAELMNAESANRFLKTLEEPPDHSTLILVTARPQALPATVRSRCQAVRFTPPPLPELTLWLQSHRGIAAQEADLLAVLATGKIGIAAEADPAELLSERNRILDAISREHLKDLVFLFDQPEELAGSQEQLHRTLDVIEVWLRDVLIHRHLPETRNLINQDIPERISDWGRGVPSDAILEIMTVIHLMKRAATRNLNNALALETVLLKMRDAVAPDSEAGTESRPAGRSAP
jgi:DNA polymerase III subunit delta'